MQGVLHVQEVCETENLCLAKIVLYDYKRKLSELMLNVLICILGIRCLQILLSSYTVL